MALQGSYKVFSSKLNGLLGIIGCKGEKRIRLFITRLCLCNGGIHLGMNYLVLNEAKQNE